jgi:hypothetical protein
MQIRGIKRKKKVKKKRKEKETSYSKARQYGVQQRGIQE